MFQNKEIRTEFQHTALVHNVVASSFRSLKFKDIKLQAIEGLQFSFRSPKYTLLFFFKYKITMLRKPGKFSLYASVVLGMSGMLLFKMSMLTELPNLDTVEVHSRSMMRSSDPPPVVVGRHSHELMVDQLNRYPLSGLADITEPRKSTDTAFYWQVPKAGGTTMKYVLSNCLDLVHASRASKDHCDIRSGNLEICRSLTMGTLINVDPSDDHGIQRAADLNLVQSGLADVLISSRFLHLTTLFDEDHKGRAFTVVRDPIVRSISTFYYLQEADWERNYNIELKNMTLLEYANKDTTSSDWMVRWLTGKNSDPVLTQSDLEFAKQVLRRKFLILLTDDMPTSVSRLVQYMGWDVSWEQSQCIQQNVIAKVKRHNENKHPDVPVGSPEYEALRRRNQLDIQLYHYALELFSQQEYIVQRHQKKKK